MAQNLLGQTRSVYPQTPGGAPSAALKRVFDNFNAVADPGVTTDSTQGYEVGSVIFNPTTLRYWECHDNTAGAAKWAFMGTDSTNGGSAPAGAGSEFGSGTGVESSAGPISKTVSSAGINPAFIGSDVVVAVYTIPANSFDGVAGTNRMVRADAWGGFSADVTVKRIKMWFSPNAQAAGNTVSGGTLMADTLATTSDGGGWWVSGNVTKYGVANSNTQLVTSNGSMASGAGGAAIDGTLVAPSLTTGLESTSLYISVTCNNTASTLSSTFSLLVVEGLN
jgi:hypothetical protein